jgi:hypothetical protein
MPNGGDKNWIRLCAAIDGFRLRYDRWPSRIRLNPYSLEDLRYHILPIVEFARIEKQLKFISDEKAGMIAEDDTGAAYDYGNEGFPETRPDPDAREWLGDPGLNPGL